MQIQLNLYNKYTVHVYYDITGHLEVNHSHIMMNILYTYTCTCIHILILMLYITIISYCYMCEWYVRQKKADQLFQSPHSYSLETTSTTLGQLRRVGLQGEGHHKVVPRRVLRGQLQWTRQDGDSFRRKRSGEVVVDSDRRILGP